MAQKKTFTSDISPAAQFISQPTEPPPTAENPEPERKAIGFPPMPPIAEPGKPPAGYKMDPRYIETKSKRLQLLLQPSLLERVKAQAKAQGTSVNDYVHGILENATKEGSD